MQRQLSLWPEEERLNIWEGLDPEAKKTLIALLSKLIGTAVRPNGEARNRHKKDAPEHD